MRVVMLQVVNRKKSSVRAGGSTVKASVRGRGQKTVSAAVLTALLLAGCGGGGDEQSGAHGGGHILTAQQQTVSGDGERVSKRVLASDVPATRAEAARFLNQATFGANDAQVTRVMALGYGAWIDEQFAKPVSSHIGNWDAWEALSRAEANVGIGQEGIFNSFWKTALIGEDQLRQRVAYALSQLFVISMQDETVGAAPRAVAHYMDMLAGKGLGDYRTLLEEVTLHPMMADYLTSLRNQKADPVTGRVPDENYAREVMQLFSIGLHQLELNGQPKLVDGQPVETYNASDISGLAKVFTGWGWTCPTYPHSNCFVTGAAMDKSFDPDRNYKQLVPYAQFHSTEEKRFLGTTIPAQSTADPRASLKAALDTIANHPNVGPFIGRQLIQRLVTSNPSPAYVAAVASAFNNNGQGKRGDMKAVVRAVLLHPEARNASGTSGLVRDPLLRITTFLRAYGHVSDSGRFRVGNTDATLGMSPMRSPSVFNFYRPGYVPPGTQTAALGLVSPEMQLTQETTAAIYANQVRDLSIYGWGFMNTQINGVTYNRRDMQTPFTAEKALADRPAELVASINARLMNGSMPAGLRDEIQATLEKIPLPALMASGANEKYVSEARRARVNAAILLALASPEYQVLK